MSKPPVSSTISLVPTNGTIMPAGVDVSSTPAHLTISKNRATGNLPQDAKRRFAHGLARPGNRLALANFVFVSDCFAAKLSRATEARENRLPMPPAQAGAVRAAGNLVQLAHRRRRARGGARTRRGAPPHTTRRMS